MFIGGVCVSFGRRVGICSLSRICTYILECAFSEIYNILDDVFVEICIFQGMYILLVNSILRNAQHRLIGIYIPNCRQCIFNKNKIDSNSKYFPMFIVVLDILPTIMLYFCIFFILAFTFYLKLEQVFQLRSETSETATKQKALTINQCSPCPKRTVYHT